MYRYIGHNDALPKLVRCIELDQSIRPTITFSKPPSCGRDWIFSCSVMKASAVYNSDQMHSGQASGDGCQNSWKEEK